MCRNSFQLLTIVLISVGSSAEVPSGYKWNLPPGVSPPRVPAGNPLTPAKAGLGRFLFYDKRMSINGTQSCASCHVQELAFTDGKAAAVGATGEAHMRGAMSLVNVAYSTVLTWSNPSLKTLEEQALTPMFSTHPVELGMPADGAEFLRIAKNDAVYRQLFARAFPGEGQPFSIRNVVGAIASFERTIVSASSPYDRYHFLQEDNAISASAKRGELLFFLDASTRCFRCHGGFNFSDSTGQFHNTGLYNLSSVLSYPAPNFGIYGQTRNPADVGKFKAPSLRNIALTAPYMHDGSIATLSEVIEHYMAGGRTIAGGAHAGVGSLNPNKDKLIHQFSLTAQAKKDLIAFLESLTDEDVIHNPKFSNPWPNELASVPVRQRRDSASIAAQDHDALKRTK